MLSTSHPRSGSVLAPSVSVATQGNEARGGTQCPCRPHPPPKSFREWAGMMPGKIGSPGRDAVVKITGRGDTRGAAGSSLGREDTGRRGGSSAARPRPGSRIRTTKGPPPPRQIRLRRSGSEAPPFPGSLHGGPHPGRSWPARSDGGSCAGDRQHHRRSRRRLPHLVRRAPLYRLQPVRSRRVLSARRRYLPPPHHRRRLPGRPRRSPFVPSRSRCPPASGTPREPPLRDGSVRALAPRRPPATWIQHGTRQDPLAEEAIGLRPRREARPARRIRRRPSGHPTATWIQQAARRFPGAPPVEEPALLARIRLRCGSPTVRKPSRP